MLFKKLLPAAASLILISLLTGCETSLVVLDPQGPVARSIADLITMSMFWMLLVVAVVIGLFVFIVWKYRERPDNKDYEPPEEHGSVKLEITWTVIPLIIVFILIVPTVTTLYDLEDLPAGYENQEPLVIHVTSADWKWIFSYPEQDIETVNYVNIPAGRPVHFRLTSAGTMQSFWVPALAGQKYTMAKMETHLYVVADYPGEYLGRNANFNGRGYALMEFMVLAQNEEDFAEWISDVRETAPELTESQYIELLKPTYLGTQTYNGTHLQWVDHAAADSVTYTNPELYRTSHGYPGRIFDEPDNYTNPDADSHVGGSHNGH